MALMSPTPRTVVLSTRQQQLKVCFCAHVARNCIEKTWPASPTVVLGCRLEQRKIARRANKGPVTFLIIERAGTRWFGGCLLYTSPSPRDGLLSRMPSSA